MGKLDGQVAFITGAARGQGRSHALTLAREGANIIAVDVDEQVATVDYATARAEDLAETVRLVEALGQRIIAQKADVRDLAALQAAADLGMSEFGRIDIIVANAGISTLAPTLEMEEEMWQVMIDVNLTGVWKTVRAAAPHIVAGERGGSIVLISSCGTHMANANIAHYTAAKCGVEGIMRVLAKELGPLGIRVNTVNPSGTATDMVLNETAYKIFRPDLEHPTRAHLEAVQGALNILPVTLLEPSDISNTVLHLVSDDARYVTGTVNLVDAGVLLHT